MNKKIRIIFIVILPLVLSACGFKPINQKNKNQINIQNINIVGEQRVAFSLKNNLLLISNVNSENKYNIKIKLEQKKDIKIKDKTGKVTRYNVTVSANLELIDLYDNKKILKFFLRKEDYLVSTNYADTISNEKNATKNIVKDLTSDISNYITLLLRNS